MAGRRHVSTLIISCAYIVLIPGRIFKFSREAIGATFKFYLSMAMKICASSFDSKDKGTPCVLLALDVNDLWLLILSHPSNNFLDSSMF